MSEQTVYLDSSAIVKRYIEEPGTEKVRAVFLKAHSGECMVSYSIWNIGEVLEVLDMARRLDRIGLEDYTLVRGRFLSEVKRMSRLGLASVIPVKTKIMSETWRLLEKHHIYQADALQIATAKHIDSAEFITGDKILHNFASAEGLNSSCLG